MDYPQHPEKKRRIRLKKPERDGAAVAVFFIVAWPALSVLVVVVVSSRRVFISSNSISSNRNSLSIDSLSSLLKSITADIIFIIIPFVFSVRKYDLISSDAL